MDYDTTTIVDVDVDVGWAVSGIENSMYVLTIYGLIAFSGIVGNLLVCFVLLRIPALRTRTSHFIINLAVNDLATSILIIPHHLFFPSAFPPAPPGFAGSLFCRLFVSKFMMWTSIAASVFSLLAVSMERYVAVVHPIKYHAYRKSFTTRVTVVMLVVTWGNAVLLSIFHATSYKAAGNVCVFTPLANTLHLAVFGVSIFSAMYALPIVIVVVLHIRIILSLRRQAAALNPDRVRQEEAATGNGHGRDRWQVRAAHEMQMTMLVVVLLFVLCWGPNHLIFLAFSLGARIDFTSQYYHFSVIVGLSNACVNPFVYVFKNSAFRQGVQQAIRRRVNRVQAADSTGLGTLATTA